MSDLTDRELATVLAALRHFQASFDYTSGAKTAYPDHFSVERPLANDDIDELCERLNCADRNAGEHHHQWGPLEHSRLAGTCHRKCQLPGCNVINALDDNEEEDE